MFVLLYTLFRYFQINQSTVSFRNATFKNISCKRYRHFIIIYIHSCKNVIIIKNKMYNAKTEISDLTKTKTKHICLTS